MAEVRAKLDLSVAFKGAPSLIRGFERLNADMQKRVLRNATSSAVAMMRAAVKAEAPRGETGRLKKGIKSRVRLFPAKAMARGSVIATAPYSHIVERGSRPHAIRAKKLKGRLFFGGVFRKGVQHPGATANPFMERGFDRSQRAAALKFLLVVRRAVTGLRFT